MNKLEKVKELRLKLIEKIMEITGLSIDNVSVDVSLTSSDSCDLITEARSLNWHRVGYGDSEWYTSEKPTAGDLVIYNEREE